MRQRLCWTAQPLKCISTPVVLKKGRNEFTGRSRGGLTTKVHAVTDGLGNPLRFLLSSGNRNDICLAKEVLEPFDLTGKLILADKGYDSDKFVRWVKERGGIPVIPSRDSARHPRKTDWHIYKERHLVENLFLKLKNHRRFSTRYEKKAVYFAKKMRYLANRDQNHANFLANRKGGRSQFKQSKAI